MQQLEIRRPRISEREKIHQFFRIMITDTWQKEGLSDLVEDIEAEIEVKKSYLQSDLDNHVDGQHFLVAIEDNRIIGTIAYGPANALIHTLTQGVMDGLTEINTAFVHPDDQGKGVGTLLLNELFQELANQGIHEFCLDSGYSRAQKIWLNKFGKPEYISKDHWGAGHDHMVWRIHI